MSHTTRVRIEFKNPAALTKAVEHMRGQVIGYGRHRLFSSTETGFGFTLPSWRYPLVAKADGQLAYDDYNGHWGNVRDIDRLKACYAIEAAKQAAEEQGWYCEVQGENLVIYHPDGGMLTIDSAGTRVDASGFTGTACADPVKQLSDAMGATQETHVKPEFAQVRMEVRE